MNIIAVTACPTGIAHSQMAAENLEQTAEGRGHEISVEIEGAMGTENELSDERIANADVVVIAADTTVHTDRFGDLPVVKGTVKDAVNRADELLDEAEEKAGEAGGGAAAAADDEAGGAGANDGGTGANDGGERGNDDGTPDAGAGDDAAETGDETSSAHGETAHREGDRGDREGLVGKIKSLFS